MSSSERNKEKQRRKTQSGDSNPFETPPSLYTRLNAAATIEQVARVAFQIFGQHIEYHFIELNVMDVSTGVLIPYRYYPPNLKVEFEPILESGYRLGEGLTGWLIENCEPLIVGDIQAERDLQPAVDIRHFPFRSYLGVPIQDNEGLIGTLEIAHLEAERYKASNLDAIAHLCNTLALKLVNLRKQRELEAAHLQSNLQQELFQQVKYRSHLDELVARLAKIIKDRLESDLIAFLVLNNETMKLEAIAPVLGPHGRLEETRFEIPSSPDSPLTSLWKTQDYWIVNQLEEDEFIDRLNLLDNLSGIEAQRFMLAPLVADSDRFGIIVTGRTEPSDPFTEEQGRILHSIGSICGLIIKLALSRKSRQQEQDLSEVVKAEGQTLRANYKDSLLQITGELASSMDLDHLLARVLNVLRSTVGADQGAFLLTAPDSNMLMLRASSGSLPPPLPGGRPTPYRVDEGLAGWVIQNRMAVCINDLQADERWIPFDDESPKQSSALVAPLIVSEEALGAILLLGHQKDAFSNDDLELISAAANQISPAIHNARLYHLIQDQAERLGLALRTQQVESSQSQAVLHAMTDGVIVTDPLHRILIFNPAVELILGLSRIDMIGEPLFKILDAFGTVGKTIGEQIRAWEASGASAVSRKITPRRIETDQNRILAIQPAPVVLGDDFLGTITIIRDITRDVELDRMKSEFVATVSHELRSPITPIKGFVDLLRMGIPSALSDEQAHYLDIIYENIHRLELLVDELLDISRIEADKVVLSFQALSVEQLVDELQAYIDHRSNTEKKRLSFQADIEANLPDIWGDSERVRQILSNLVDNSFDYTPDGGWIKLEAQNVGDQIEIAISDNGMGIAVGEQERIFERFYRGEQALIMGVAGAGLGLSIALAMVEMHGGRIWVNSAGIPGKGSTFTVSLPIATADSEPEKVIHKK